MEPVWPARCVLGFLFALETDVSGRDPFHLHASIWQHRHKIAVLVESRCPRVTEMRDRLPVPAAIGKQQRLSKHTKFVQDMLWEMWGFATYKWRAMELLSVQAQACTQVQQEEGGHSHPCQEKVVGADEPSDSKEEVIQQTAESDSLCVTSCVRYENEAN